MNDELKKESRSTVKPFRVCTGLELVNAAPEHQPCLVEGLLPEVGTSMTVGKPKCGKSVFVQNLACSVAEDKPFLGMPTKCGDVLFLNLDGSAGVVAEHFKRLGVTQKRGVIHLVTESMPFHGDEGLRRLRATLGAHPRTKLVVIDTVAKFLRAADSDKYDQMVLALEKLEVLAKDYRLHLMFTTHAKKRATDDAGDASIGSTAFRGSTDTNLFLSKRDSQRILSAEMRWGSALESTLLNFDADRFELSIGPLVADAEQAERERRERKTLERIEKDIFDALLVKKLTTAELLEQVTGKTSTVLGVVKRLESIGAILSEQDGKATVYSRVSLPEEEAA